MDNRTQKDALGELSPAEVNIFVGAHIEEKYSGYTLSARMPDGRLVFRGPRFIEGRGQSEAGVKLAALNMFLESSRDLLSSYGEGLKMCFWSNDDALAGAWKKRLQEPAAERDPGIWDRIMDGLSRCGASMEVRGVRRVS